MLKLRLHVRRKLSDFEVASPYRVGGYDTFTTCKLWTLQIFLIILSISFYDLP